MQDWTIENCFPIFISSYEKFKSLVCLKVFSSRQTPYLFVAEVLTTLVELWDHFTIYRHWNLVQLPICLLCILKTTFQRTHFNKTDLWRLGRCDLKWWDGLGKGNDSRGVESNICLGTPGSRLIKKIWPHHEGRAAFTKKKQFYL